MSTPKLEPLSAREFFARKLDGCSKTDARHGTKLAWSTIHDTTRGTAMPDGATLLALHEWSLRVGEPHGVCISVEKTLAEVRERAENRDSQA